MTNDAPKPNVELLDRTLAEVRKAARRKRLRWEQKVYRLHTGCGTAMCFAGWAVTLAGRTWADVVDPDAGEEDVLSRSDDPGPPYVGYASAHSIARHELGLTPGEALDLFHENNTLRDLTRIVREIKRRA